MANLPGEIPQGSGGRDTHPGQWQDQGSHSGTRNTDQAALENLARTDPRCAERTGGKSIVKAIIVPGRLVNFVVK